MPLWYVLREPPSGGPRRRLWAWTYAASQKVRNLERDPRATLQVEAGEAYEQLRGVMLECEVVIHRDLAHGAPRGRARSCCATPWRAASSRRRSCPSQAREAIAAQAAKRVALEFAERRRATWDHRKLGGSTEALRRVGSVGAPAWSR